MSSFNVRDVQFTALKINLEIPNILTFQQVIIKLCSGNGQSCFLVCGYEQIKSKLTKINYSESVMKLLNNNSNSDS